MAPYSDIEDVPSKLLYAPSLPNYCYAGFPNDDGNGSEFSVQLRLAISAQSLNKDAAWEFLRTALNEESQNSIPSIPSSISVLEAHG